MTNLKNKKNIRIRRAMKYRLQFKKLYITRLVVHRTSRHIYAQIISHDNRILTVASTLENKIQKKVIYTGNKKAASIIGSIIASRAIQKGINRVSFDRSGFKYHGRIKAVADSARHAGLHF
ncbi:50S ribosomal protein L18 [Buchnera aphidicola]|uniref:50S ribosomal protein L18 n=1 Tax=Buchnera aphidicola TaxID=9 RepID=UPI0034645FA6